MPESHVIHVSKLDAAKRQLEHAIKLFFRYGDVVVIHSITAGAHEILCDLADKKGIKTIFRDLNVIRPEKRKEVSDLMREPQNFFKHSDRPGDETKTIQFTPLLTEMQLFDSCLTYKAIVGEIVPIFLLFEVWFYTKNPDTVVEPNFKKSIQDFMTSFHHTDRAKFLTMLPELETLIVQ